MRLHNRFRTIDSSIFNIQKWNVHASVTNYPVTLNLLLTILDYPTKKTAHLQLSSLMNYPSGNGHRWLISSPDVARLVRYSDF